MLKSLGFIGFRIWGLGIAGLGLLDFGFGGWVLGCGCGWFRLSCWGLEFGM